MPIDEHHILVPRTARYYTLGDASPGTRRVWFACHGYAQLAERFLRDLAPLHDDDTLLVAPEGLSRMYLRSSSGTVGASWMTREDRLHEIADYVHYLDMTAEQVLAGMEGAVIELTLLGFSQGTATVGRWLALGNVRPHRVILCGGLLPPDPPLATVADRLRGTEFVYSVGTDDELIDRAPLEAQINELRSLGAHPRLIEFSGGHRVDTEGLAALDRTAL